jgi:hypothetical protein
MKVNVYLSILIVAISLLACKSETEKQAVEQIDKLLQKNESVYQTLNGKIVDSVKAYHDSLDQMNQFFETHTIESFPENQSLTRAYHKVTNARKVLGHYTNRHLPQMNEKLKTSEQQLKDLRHDIENGLYEDSTITRYLNQEDSVMQFLVKGANSQIETARRYFDAYPENKVKIDSLVMWVKANQGIDE